MGEYINRREEAFKGQELKACPFCGFKPNIMDEDCIYPSGPARNEDGSYQEWHVHCYETGGGCCASVYGTTAQEAIDNWNHRVSVVTETNNELKNCPKCNSEMDENCISVDTYHNGYIMWTIACSHCKTDIISGSLDDLMDTWNSRGKLNHRETEPMDWDEYETQLAIGTLTRELSEKEKSFYDKMAKRVGLKKEE